MSGAVMSDRPVLAEAFGSGGVGSGALGAARQVALVVAGVAALAISAKVSVPMWPVPITLQTLFVLMIGAGYGVRLGVVTILAYLALGAVGADVFTGSSAEVNGLAYMLGTTGGYLFGFVIAAAAIGALARRGWDRSILTMALAMLIGTVLIYAPGVAWLGHVVGWDKPVLEWGLYPFLVGDALKLALAALLFPGLWALLRERR